MSQGKTKFARRLGTLALAGLFIAGLLILNESMGRMQYGPRHHMGVLSMLLMLLGLLMGLIGTPIYFLLLLIGWVDPAKKPVYLRRLRRTALLSGVALLASLVTFLMATEDAAEVSGVLGIIMLLVMVASGVAALIFYLAGWSAQQPSAPQRHALGIPRVGGRVETHAAPLAATRSDPFPPKTSFMGRLGRVFIGVAIFVAVATIPCALVAVGLVYAELPEADRGYIFLTGPLAFGFVLTVGLSTATVSAVIGMICKAIGRRR